MLGGFDEEISKLEIDADDMSKTMETESPLEDAINLIGNGFFESADRILTTCVESDSAEVLVALEWAKLASICGHHKDALARIGVVKSRFEQVDWTEVELEILVRARMFNKCIEKIEELRTAVPNPLKWDKKIEVINSMIAIQRSFISEPGDEKDYVSYCINLDEHKEKWARSEREARNANILTDRLAGVKGSYIPSQILSRFGKKVNAKFKGTLGCFISHFHCWDNFLSSDSNYVLVLEDDFRPRFTFPQKLAKMGIPAMFDICWLNQRMSVRNHGALEFLDVREVVRRKSSPRWLGSGGEGYILSRDGARKLIEYVNEDGFYGDVDWRMIAYALDPVFIRSLSINDFSRKAIEAHFGVIKSRKPLKCFAASPGLIGLVDTGSGREQQNVGKHAHESI